MTSAEANVKNLVVRGQIGGLRITEWYDADAQPILRSRFQATADFQGDELNTYSLAFSREQAFADLLRDLVYKGVAV